MSDTRPLMSRRTALKCLAFGSAGTLFTLSGGVLTSVTLAGGAEAGTTAVSGKPLFVQISDTHTSASTRNPTRTWRGR
jgi:hypothetical protein